MDQSTRLRKWIDAPGNSVKSLAARLFNQRRRRASLRYLESIADGYYPPGRKLAIDIAAVTGIPVGELVDYPYRAPRAA